MRSDRISITGPFLTDDEAAQAVSPGGFGAPDPSTSELGVLLGLQQQASMYYGTVDPAVVAQRRRRNKAARKARRAARR